ncbi:MAG: hypothetical protein AB7D27_14665 [Desulfomicrobium sp.]
MATARRIINRALRLIGVLASGETASAAEAQDALEALNDMLDNWSISSLIIPYKVTQALTVSASPVALAVRPVRVTGAWINDGASDLQMTLLSQADYLSIANKALTGLPTSICNDGITPVASLYLYPVPDKAYALTLQRWDALASIGALDDEIELPTGYREALATNLAIRLAPEYGTTTPTEVAAMAATALDMIRSLNSQPVATLGVQIQSTTQQYGLAGTDSLAAFLSGGWMA